MPNQIDTGNGATIAVTGLTPGKVISIGSMEETVGRLDISDLSTTGHAKYMPGDLIEHSEIEYEFYLGTQTFPTPGLDYGGTLASPRTIAITFPSNGALTGTGFITKRRFPQLQNNQPQVGMIGVSFDGNTAPAFDAGA